MNLTIARYGAVASAVIMTCIGFGSTGHADGLLQRLPDDGAWARFDMVVEYYDVESGAPLGWQSRGSLTLSSVGKAIVEGEACRIIEFSFRSKMPGRDGRDTEDDVLNVWKLLIPEIRAAAGQNPLDNVRRGWLKLQAPPRNPQVPLVTQRELNLAKETNYRHRLRLELPDVSKDAEKLDAEKIECKSGEYVCDGISGTDVGRWPVANGATTQFQYETRLHKDVPFGVVRHRCTMKGHFANGKLATHRVTTYTLAEVGNNAASEIPEDLNPELAFRLLTTAENLLAEDKLDEAVAEFTRSLSFAPSYAATHDGRGQALVRKGDYKRAIADFRESIRRDPKSPYAPNHLAWVLATCPDETHRDGKEAVSEATRACELSGWKKAAFLATLAAAHAEAGQFDAAVKWQTKAIELATAEDLPDLKKKWELFKTDRPYRDEPKK